VITFVISLILNEELGINLNTEINKERFLLTRVFGSSPWVRTPEVFNTVPVTSFRREASRCKQLVKVGA
jgi:hypothetical protein